MKLCLDRYAKYIFSDNVSFEQVSSSAYFDISTYSIPFRSNQLKVKFGFLF